jgi:Subtilase family
MRRFTAFPLALLVLLAAAAPASAAPNRGDATVIAVIDSGINPYHWDMLASRTPADVPLDTDPTRWLPGMDRGAFASFEALGLSREETDGSVTADSLAERDAATLGAVKSSSEGQMHGYWIPGTKIIGAVTFDDQGELYKGVSAHGAGVASSATGALHGTCPECLLVFIDKGETAAEAEAAIEWAESQPWIDAITNSYGFSTVYRDRIYSGSDVDAQRVASERGQTIFFSAGNGQANTFTAPNPTTFSSQEGPDWIVTVGAVAPGQDNYYGSYGSGSHGQFLGSGKPADIAGIGLDYPTAYSSPTVGGTGETGFSGTSNATPQIAGLYARGLSVAREKLRGRSRTQDGGVVATGRPVRCGAAWPDCALGDGTLTAAELRTRLFGGAIPTGRGTTTIVGGRVPNVGEEELLSQGHGAYFGRESSDRSAWLHEFDRIVAPMEGRVAPLRRPDGEHEWMVVDSYCRQENWGHWRGGYFVEGETELPGQSTAWPIRSAREQSCPGGSP